MLVRPRQHVVAEFYKKFLDEQFPTGSNGRPSSPSAGAHLGNTMQASSSSSSHKTRRCTVTHTSPQNMDSNAAANSSSKDELDTSCRPHKRRRKTSNNEVRSSQKKSEMSATPQQAEELNDRQSKPENIRIRIQNSSSQSAARCLILGGSTASSKSPKDKVLILSYPVSYLIIFPYYLIACINRNVAQAGFISLIQLCLSLIVFQRTSILFLFTISFCSISKWSIGVL